MNENTTVTSQNIWISLKSPVGFRQLRPIFCSEPEALMHLDRDGATVIPNANLLRLAEQELSFFFPKMYCNVTTRFKKIGASQSPCDILTCGFHSLRSLFSAILNDEKDHNQMQPQKSARVVPIVFGISWTSWIMSIWDKHVSTISHNHPSQNPPKKCNITIS